MTNLSIRSFVASCFALALVPGTAFAQSLPTGWSTKDVGAVAATGSATSVNNIFTVAGSGADVWGTADEFRFVYKQLAGDGSIVTQVSTVENVNAWVKAGVMMRESLNANSRHAFMLVSPGAGLAFQRRASTGGSSTHTAAGSGGAPYFLKLTRAGQTFTAHKSLDGVKWTLVGSQSMTMASTIYVGVAVSSHVDGVLADAMFSQTAVTAAPPQDGGGSTAGTTLRVLNWNTHHGRGSDNTYDLDRIATWIAKMNPDVVSLNEVERFSGSHGNEDQPARYAALLKAKTGKTWYTHYLSARGTTTGGGSAILSRYPITARNQCVSTSTNNAVHATIDVNGRTVNIWSTHLPSGDSSSPRVNQAGDVLACARQYSENRIIAGDWNATSGRAEYLMMLDGYYDAWTKAKAAGDAIDFVGNTRDGATHNYRIDYVFHSKGAALRLEQAQVYSTKGSDGSSASDHKPLVATFTLN